MQGGGTNPRHCQRARQVAKTDRFGFPKEDHSIFQDSVAVLKDAKNLENAAMISNFATYANGIKGSEKFMKDGLKDAPELNVPPELQAAGGWQDVCPPEVNDVYTKIWKELLK